MAKRAITRADVMPVADYAKMRRDHRRKMIETKKQRRLEVGPHACFYFESYDTMWTQVHEMLLIEKGGEEQIPNLERCATGYLWRQRLEGVFS